MADYASLKVPELKKLLAEKSLSQTGNKADLIARLVEDDKKNATEEDSKPAEPEKKPDTNPEDEISYSDDEAPASKPVEQTAEAPAEAAAPVQEAAPENPPTNFAMGLSTTSADDEAKKRADRAKRFGISEDEDAKKKAERASRFGIDEKELASGLDAALPERRREKRGGGRRDGGRRENGRRGDGRRGDGQRGVREGRVTKRVVDDPTEKAKAEKRAARFAAAA